MQRKLKPLIPLPVVSEWLKEARKKFKETGKSVVVRVPGKGDAK